MLHLSENTIDGKINRDDYPSFKESDRLKPSAKANKIMIWLLVLVVFCAFLPWTQYVDTRGEVTALNPSQRPTTINSVIPGRLEEWFIKEGQPVKKGDTILKISEIKDEYFDPNLIERVKEQLNAKVQSQGAYGQKVSALNTQEGALKANQALKYEQAKIYYKQAILKNKADSIDFVAAKTNYRIAQEQAKRFETLLAQGLKSRTEVEAYRLKLQETQAKLIGAETKLLNSKNDIVNSKIALNNIENEFSEKISKTRSDRSEALSSGFTVDAEIAKLKNQTRNYEIRQQMRYVTAPQDGFVIKAIKTGIGENIKEGESLVTIMPSQNFKAVELFIAPIDIPLVNVGQEVQLIFDGWPSIVFSGWPRMSYGTFKGKVVAKDRFISPNGKFRLLISPFEDEKKWPEALQLGAGVRGIALLKDVTIGYEVWRRLNGFPADFYIPETTAKKSK